MTAIVRNAEKAADLGVPILERDVFSLKTDDLKDFDAVVSAFGVSPGSGLEFQYQTVGFTLSHLFEQLPEVRLLIVGGAASLFTDETMKTRVIESGAIPEAYAAVPYHAWQSFMALQKSSCKWTYFSPALTFDRKGERTGAYRLGTDVVILNDSGESYISYPDYAVAMVDEIEQGRFIRKRFTAVSNRKEQDLVPKKEEAADSAGKEENIPENSSAGGSEGTVQKEAEQPKSEQPKRGLLRRLFGW